MSEHKAREAEQAAFAAAFAAEREDRYFTNPIDGFSNGALLDIRLRTAIQLLCSPMFSGLTSLGSKHELPMEQIAATHAEFALKVSEHLIELSEQRGYIAPFPDGLTPDMEAHAKRVVDWQLAQQRHAQKAQGSVATLGPRPN